MSPSAQGVSAMSARDEFKAATKTALARRAAHFCSNPYCLKLTVGPSSVPTQALMSGHAAHIHAAAKGGEKNVRPRLASIMQPHEVSCYS